MVTLRSGIALILIAIGAAIVIAYRKQLQATGEAIGGGLKGLAGGLGEVITKPGIALADVGGRLLGLVPGIPATPALPFGGIAAPPMATVAPNSPTLSGGGGGSVATADNVTVTPGNREFSDIQAKAERAPSGTKVSALFQTQQQYEAWKRRQSAIGKAVLQQRARAAPKIAAGKSKKKCRPEFGGVNVNA